MDNKENNGQNIGYVRVSSDDQNIDRQMEALYGYHIDQFFTEKKSGKDMDREQLLRMLNYIRKGDTVYVTEFSRLGRSTSDLLAIVKKIEEKGATICSIKESFDTRTPAGKLQMTMLAAVAEFERAMIKERQAEGIAIAKKKGVYKGRKAVTVPNLAELYAKHKSGIPLAKLAREAGVCRATMYKLFKEYENKNTLPVKEK